MPWVPIHESGREFSFSGTQGTSIDGSVVSGVPGNPAEDQGWTIFIGGGDDFTAAMARVTVLSMDDGGHEYGGFFRFQEEFIGPGVTIYPTISPPTVDPNPIYPDGPSIRVEYHATHGWPSGDPVETYSMLVEVFVEGSLAANDDDATTPMNTPVTVPVLANDTLGDEPVTLGDLAGPPTIVTQPPAGTATVNDDGTITYTPPDGFTGEVEFQYMIKMPEPEVCAHIVFSDNWDDGSQSFFDIDFTNKPSWFDRDEQFEIDFGNGIAAAYEWQGYYNMVSDNQVLFCGEGEGTLSQGDNSICLEWLVEGECPA